MLCPLPAASVLYRQHAEILVAVERALEIAAAKHCKEGFSSAREFAALSRAASAPVSYDISTEIAPALFLTCLFQQERHKGFPRR